MLENASPLQQRSTVMLKAVIVIVAAASRVSAQCSFQMSQGTPCGSEYVGFPVLTASSPSEDKWNAFLATLTPSQVSNQFMQFGCTAPNVALLQYQLSFWCSRAAYEALQAGCASSAASTNAALCAAQCSSAQTSIANVINDPAGCPASSSTAKARSTLVSMFSSACTNFATAGTTCLPGNTYDINNCGFLDPATACALPENSGTTCCQKFIAQPSSSATSTAATSTGSDPGSTTSAVTSANLPTTGIIVSAPPLTSNSALNNTLNNGQTGKAAASSSGPSVGAIVGGAVALIILIAAGYAGFVFYRKRSDKQRLFKEYMIEKRPVPYNFQNDSTSNLELSQTKKTFASMTSKLENTSAANSHRMTNLMSGVPDSIVKSPNGGESNGGLSPTTGGKTYRVVHPYRGVLNDELTLVVGSEVIMTKEHNDGWADGIDPITGARGVFPIICVVDPDDVNKNTSKTDFRVSVRQSSIYSRKSTAPVSQKGNTRQSTASQFSMAPTKTNKSLYKVMHTYEAQLDDELTITAGNDIIVIQEFDDGWAKGMEPSSGKIGLFPMTCVAHVEDTAQQQRMSKHASVYSKRTSSISRRSVAPSRDKDSLTVLHSYDATESDELTLIVGHTIAIIEEFDDGWCEGRDVLNGKSGIFPMACVTRNSGGAATRRPESFAKRRSSIKSMMKTETRLAIVHQYIATQSDELTLEIGKDIVLIKEFNDGWARGKNPETGQVGMFPMICVSK